MNPVQAMLNEQPESRERLAILGLFQGCASARLLAALCASDATPEELRGISLEDWIELFERLEAKGLIQRPDPATAQLPLPTHQAAQTLLQERLAGRLIPLEQAFCDIYTRFASEVNRDFKAHPERAEPLLRAEEANLMQALELASRHARWPQAEELLRAIEKLFAPAAHWAEWQWVLRGFEDRLLAAPTPPTTPAIWERTMALRCAIPRQARDLDGEQAHLLRLRDYFQQQRDQAGVVRSLRQLARLANAGALHSKEENYYRECVSLAASLRNDSLHCTVLLDLGRSLRSQHHSAEAEAVLLKGLALAESLADSRRSEQALAELDETARALREFDRAEGYCRRLLESAEKRKDLAAQAESLERLGTVALAQERPTDAERSFARARELWTSAGAPSRAATALVYLGDAATHQKDRRRAEALFEEGLREHRRVNDAPGQAFALARLGAAALEAHDLDKAGQLLFECQKFLGSLRDPKLEADIFTGLGRIAYCREAFANAQNFYQQSLTLLEQIGALAEIADVLYNLGLVAERLKDLPRARKRHQRSLEFAARAGDGPKQAQALLQLASIALQQGQFHEAERRCLECLPLAQQQNAAAQIAEIHYRLGRIHVQLCRPEAAGDHFRTALQTHPAGEDLDWHLKVLGHLTALPQLSKDELAVHCQRILQMAEANGETATQLKLLYKLAELAESRQLWLDAEHWLRRCLSLEQQAQSTGPQAQLLQRIGLNLERQGRPREAVALFQRSIDLNGFPSGDHAYHTEVMLRLADDALLNHQPEDALIHYQHCLRLSKDLGDIATLVKAALGLGRIALRSGDLDNARDWLNQAEGASDHGHDPDDRAAVLMELGDLEAQSQAPKAAERHYETALEIYQSIPNESAEAGAWVKLGELSEAREAFDDALGRFDRARALYQVLRDAPNLYRTQTAIQRLQKSLP